VKEHNFEQLGWSLDALLPAREGEGFERVLEELEQQVVQFEGARERLSPEMSNRQYTDLIAWSRIQTFWIFCPCFWEQVPFLR